MVIRVEEEPLLNEGEPKEAKITHPLDEEVLSLKNGFIPGWDRVVTKLDLFDLPRGEKKLFRSFYRAHRMYARGKKVKGRRLMDSLTEKKNFISLEEKYPHKLRKMVDMFSKQR